jgi:phage/plasmid-like protein (TIGR03299 family)
MGHNLNKNKDGQYAFASVREIPWHKLGQVVDKAMTSAQAIKAAKLDYNVDKCNVHATISEVTPKIPGKFATYRTDTREVFGIVGDRYEIVQNVDAFAFFDAIVGEGSAIYETAGAFGKGERIFITAKLPKSIIVGKDVIDQYLFLTNSHDGSGSVRAAFTPVRIVCNNTFNMAMTNNSHMVSIRHTKHVKSLLKAAHMLMDIVAWDAGQLQQQAERMVKHKITDDQLRSFIAQVMKPKREEADDDDKAMSSRLVNIVDEVMEYNAGNPTQQTPETKGTLYGALNAVTGYFQNAVNYADDEDRLRTTVLGRGARKGGAAYNLAINVMRNIVKLQ